MVYRTYSQRRRDAEGTKEPDVFSYDFRPELLKRQIRIALMEGIGKFERSPSSNAQHANGIWRTIDDTCMREVASYENSSRYQAENFLVNLDSADDDAYADMLDIACAILSLLTRGRDFPDHRGASLMAKTMFAEINERFKQHARGYQIENGQLVRVDSAFIHAEVVKPALAILSDPLFAKANEDFRDAHRHYREGHNKSAVSAAANAYESALKAICTDLHWHYEGNAVASELVKVVSQNGLFSHDFDKGLQSFVAMLKTGIPDIRNRAGSHGDAPDAAEVEPHIARLALNLTASHLLFLGECFEALRRRGR